MSLIALIPAGGVGERALDKLHSAPKQYRLIADKSLLQHSVEALLSDQRVAAVHIGVAADDPFIEAETARLAEAVTIHRSGGASRAQTVLQTLEAIDRFQILSDEDWVLVHDAARPGLSAAALTALIDACFEQQCGGILAMPVPDTVKRVVSSTSSDKSPRIEATVPREGLWLAQTPQLFKAIELKDALKKALAEGAEITDEASAMEYIGQQPLLVRGHAENFKITWPQDFRIMEHYLTKHSE
ncbi:MAG: 2-C-methyl-D-erythritol 4-phosphate cytidylyltransferase [Alcaligenaceae bacterium]|nr:2-C-methyl-D-erythritol 4-phosphate cytidylyltransferase [Alcaligenaceae bacterium]